MAKQKRAKTTDSRVPAKTSPPAKRDKSAGNKKEDDFLYAKDSFLAFVDTRKVKKASHENLEQFKIGQLTDNMKEGDASVKVLVFGSISQTEFKLEKVTAVKIFDYQILKNTKAKKTDATIKITKADSTKLKILLPNTVEKVLQQLGIEYEDSESEQEEPGEKVEPKQKKVVKIKRSQSVRKKKESAEVLPEIKKIIQEEEKEDIPEVGVKSKNPPKIGAEQISTVKKKVGKQAEVVVNKVVKKAVQRPTEFKLGKWNPNTVLEKSDTQWFEDSDNPNLYECCHACNERSLFRAVNTDNNMLLQNLVHDFENISSLSVLTRSNYPFCRQNILDLIMKKGDMKMLEIVLNPTGIDITSNEAKNAFYHTIRKSKKPFLLKKIEQGQVSHMAYGTAIRRVEITRGNRQGNNAFYNNSEGWPGQPQYNPQTKDGVSFEMFKAYHKLNNSANPNWDWKNHVRVNNMVVQGKREYIAELIKAQLSQENYGWNQLHLDVMTKETLTEKYHTASLTKKCTSQNNVTPIHLACLNPHIAVLKKLMDQNPDVNVMDGYLSKPLHFAACCENTHALELLLSLGANLNDLNSTKQSALHFAAQAGMAENVTLILEKQPQIAKLRDRRGCTAMAYACEIGNNDVIEAFLKSKVVKVGQMHGQDRLTPLAYAAVRGDFDLCVLLLEEYKARVMSKDKFKRIPLHHAIINGNARVASLLLQYGTDWQFPDSSGNTALHYAAGFGQLQCMRLLLEHGADINAHNMWKITPINIAMLCNHVGAVKKLLDHEGVDVNGKDDKGRTLLALSVADLSDSSMVEFAAYLLSKGADPNIPDILGNTILHHLAAFNPNLVNRPYNVTKQEHVANMQQEKDNHMAMLMLILDSGKAELNALNNDKKTPFVVALATDNIKVLEKLSVNVMISKSPELLFNFQSKIFDHRYKDFLVSILDKEPELDAKHLNIFDSQGFTPFLAYMKQFIDLQQDFKKKLTDALHILILDQIEMPEFNFDMLTNEAIFAAHAPVHDNKWHENVTKIQQKLPQAEFDQILKQKLSEHIIKPLIEFLDMLVSRGANPHAKVDRLEFYRELDEHKRQVLTINELRSGISAIHQDVQMEAKTRTEVLIEQNAEKKNKNKKDKIHEKLKKFYSERNFTPQYEKLEDGLENEIEYDKEYGCQNAVHLLMRNPKIEVMRFLVEKLNIDFDCMDYLGRNPFLLNALVRPAQVFDASMKFLLGKQVSVDKSDRRGRTPLLIYYDSRNLVNTNVLMDHHQVNVNHMDKAGLFMLKYALIRRDSKEIDSLVQERGAHINKLDNKGRNLLHHAINMSSATADATFETEQQLIDLGIDINHKDHNQRVPLHYAFVKIKDWSNTGQLDPIETVSSMCGQQGLLLDQQDKWGKTPLHYAAQRGASICTLYIIQRGANKENVDIYGNTPLATAMLASHFNYCILLIQSKVNVLVAVTDEYPRHIEYQWKKEAGELMDDSDDDQLVKKKAHRNLFTQKATTNIMFGGDSYGSESENNDDDQSDDEDSSRERNVFNNQTGFKVPVYKKKVTKNFQLARKSTGQIDQEPMKKTGLKELPPLVKRVRSTFRIAIQAVQQGLAYMILDNGYNYMKAMQDAMDENKFQLVVTLLQKTADDAVVCQKNDKGQNLLHILAQNAGGCENAHMVRIFDIFKKRGINVLDYDDRKSSALHYAVTSESPNLVKLLILHQVPVNDINSEGHSPLSLHLKSRSALTQSMHNDQIDTIFTLLAKRGADMNILYPEKRLSKYLSTQVDGEYMCTPLVLFVRQLLESQHMLDRASFDLLVTNLTLLVQYGGKPDFPDSEGRTALMYAVMSNDRRLVAYLVSNYKVSRFEVNGQDNSGKTVAHYLVQPLSYGSYENAALLEYLFAECNLVLDLKDINDRTPLDLACNQKSQVMSQALRHCLGVEQPDSMFQITDSEEEEWPAPRYNFTEDADELLNKAEEKRQAEILDQDKEYNFVPVDVVIPKEEIQYKVYYTEEGKPYDCYLQKVDLKNGPYGDYVFYKIQLLHDTNRDLYLVLTRYGRIGEEGMHQRSPFPKLEDAITEFHTIFKQKTSNDFTDLQNFTKAPKKYSMVKVHYSSVKHQDYLAPFDFDNLPKSQLMGKRVHNLLEEISNVTMFRRAVSSMGIDEELMPTSSLKKDTLVSATAILKELSLVVEERDIEIRKGLEGDNQLLDSAREKVSSLSSEFYELIPFKEAKNTIAQPMRNAVEIKNRYSQIEALLRVEFSSRLLLGAIWRQKEFNPIDYVYQSIGTRIQIMEEGDPECELIRKYVTSTGGDQKKFNVFRIERQGEAERFSQFDHLSNKRLLFHGSGISNYLGILAEGLRIAPPTAPVSGYMFGKGVYFADMFTKASAYAQSGSSSASSVMLVAEVALGRSKKLREATYVENLAEEFQSVQGCGAAGPDFKARRIVTPKGFSLAHGPAIKYPVPADWEAKQKLEEPLAAQKKPLFGGGFGGGYNRFGGNTYSFGQQVPQVKPYFNLAHNEYIVYNVDQIKIRYMVQFI